MTDKTLKEIASELGELLERKNSAYGSAFDKAEEILKVLKPDGIKPDEYGILLIVTRIIDKLFRIAADPTLDTKPRVPEIITTLFYHLRHLQYSGVRAGSGSLNSVMTTNLNEIFDEIEKAFAPEDPFEDIAGYGVLGVDKRRREGNA